MLPPRTDSTANAPRGFTLLELMLALMLLGLFAAMLSPLLMASARERRTAIQEQLALQLAANQLEWLTLHPPAPTTEPQRVPVSDHVTRWLPHVEQTVQATAEETGLRITVTITWQHRPGTAHKPVVLAGWAVTTEARP